MNTETKDKPIKAIPLPIGIIREALELDRTSKTGLRWKTRPVHHFCNKSYQKRWNDKWAGKEAGAIAGFENQWKYWHIGVNGRGYKCHRIVWALLKNQDPGEWNIDHIDGDGLNNSPDNLRIATQSQNLRNKGAQKNSKSGIKGVSMHACGKWTARIKAGGKYKHLGLFRTTIEAATAYAKAAAQYHGEFARTA